MPSTQKLARRIRPQVIIDFLLDEGLLRSLIRFVTILGGAFLIVEVVDRFLPETLPDGTSAMFILILIVLCLTLAVEVIVAHSNDGLTSPEVTGNREDDLARSILAYAADLANSRPPRDAVLLELRRWASRLFHVQGRHADREGLGQLAIGAAAGLGEQATEAEVLIDDIGWSLIAQGRDPEAERSIRRGINLLSSLPEEIRETPRISELLIKAKRHLVGVELRRGQDIDEACRTLDSLRRDTESFSTIDRELQLAQLDHAEAALTLWWLERQLEQDKGAIYRPPLTDYKEAAVDAAEKACHSFQRLGDTSREIKAMRVLVRILALDGMEEHKRSSVEARLKRMEQVADRNA